MNYERTIEVKDCGHCNNVCYKEQGPYYHTQNSIATCRVCQICITQDSPDLKYCVAIGHTIIEN